VAELAPIAERFHVTRSTSERAIGAGALAQIVRHEAPDDAVGSFDALSDAVTDARAWASESPRRAVVVTGSITLVGDAIQLAEREGWK
jgi:dihydrofolate synthase / folylpolyglutamate synthase